MKPPINALIILLIAVLLFIVHETVQPIPSWVFILLLVAWLIVRFGPRFRR